MAGQIVAGALVIAVLGGAVDLGPAAVGQAVDPVGPAGAAQP